MKNKVILFGLCLGVAAYAANTSVQALNSYEKRYDALMNNVVNANTPGFKATQVVTLQEKGQIKTEALPVVNKPGPLIYSGDPYHVGLDGPGFFVVKGPKNEDYYTRDGRFKLNSEYNLVTVAGDFPVYGKGGLIQMQPGQNGTLVLTISDAGQIVLNGAALDQFLVVGVADPTQLEPLNGAFFRKKQTLKEAAYQNEGALGGEATDQQDFLPLDNYTLHQYYYEGSNVDIAEEMVSMPGISKKFDANSKTLQIMKKMRTTGRELGSPQ